MKHRPKGKRNSSYECVSQHITKNPRQIGAGGKGATWIARLLWKIARRIRCNILWRDFGSLKGNQANYGFGDHGILKNQQTKRQLKLVGWFWKGWIEIMTKDRQEEIVRNVFYATLDLFESYVANGDMFNAGRMAGVMQQKLRDELAKETEEHE